MAEVGSFLLDLSARCPVCDRPLTVEVEIVGYLTPEAVPRIVPVPALSERGANVLAEHYASHVAPPPPEPS